MKEVRARRPLADSTAVHDQVYDAIRQALITGKIAPGVGVSLRSLAAELGVSPMPVRDAVRRQRGHAFIERLHIEAQLDARCAVGGQRAQRQRGIAGRVLDPPRRRHRRQPRSRSARDRRR